MATGQPEPGMTEPFRQECDLLFDLVRTVSPGEFSAPTQFKGWTVDDVLVHLHGWNQAVSLALTDPAAFDDYIADSIEVMQREGMRAWDARHVAERGPALVDAWYAGSARLADLVEVRDPRSRIRWVGPPMALRTAIAARQMETWAHGSAVFDGRGMRRVETDRIRPIVELGWKTYAWSWKVRGEEPPPVRPAVELQAPSGATWAWPGDEDAGCVRGPAADFAAVVTQTRNVADTALRVEGKAAQGWMRRAQCFAGAPETPPAAGARFRAG